MSAFQIGAPEFTRPAPPDPYAPLAAVLATAEGGVTLPLSVPQKEGEDDTAYSERKLKIAKAAHNALQRYAKEQEVGIARPEYVVTEGGVTLYFTKTKRKTRAAKVDEMLPSGSVEGEVAALSEAIGDAPLAPAEPRTRKRNGNG